MTKPAVSNQEPTLLKPTEPKQSAEPTEKEKAETITQVLGIQQSSLGIFQHSTATKEEPMVKPTSSVQYTLSFKSAFGGNSAATVGFGTAPKTNSFADLLKSPVKKRAIQESSDAEEDVQETNEVQWKPSDFKDVEPWESRIYTTSKQQLLQVKKKNLHCFLQDANYSHGQK